MKVINKVTAAVFGLVFISSAVSAQSIDDAKKAIGAEQYQKAKTMLQNLTVTQATKGENYFYLGWVYLVQDEPDSAKLWFNKGVAADNKSALNYAGLGAVARFDKDANGASSNFTQAMALAKKDVKPYIYIGKSYLLKPNGSAVSTADAEAAIGVLTKGQAINAKDPELFIALGDAYSAEMKGSDAYTAYQTALTLDPKSTAAQVALGVVSKFANNFEDAEAHFKAAIAIDPDYGPAYREWAETDLRWSQEDAKMSAKATQAADLYKKYISLTDLSVQSRMRYADFLILAKDYKTLQQEATELSKSASTNLRIYRYLGYSAYENKDYAAGLTALNTWMTKADPKRIIPLDYVYLGRLQIASGQDSLGIINLKKAYSLDSTQTEILGDIAKSDYEKKKYKQAGDEYALYVSKYPRASFNDLFKEGLAYYLAYNAKTNPDTTLLIKADSALSKIQQKATAPVPTVVLYRAYVNDMKDADRNNIKGLAKPYYEQYITLVTAKTVLTDDDKKNLVTAYDYLGRYYEYKEKDDTKAADNYNKAKAIDPTDPQVMDFFKRKGK